ncbi:serine/threonine-protein kinase [Myxococcota bacterium]|nr:serine/threonine-protein kinase [Myxococcota bacterium]
MTPAYESPPSQDVGQRVIARRYRTQALLGRGGQGEVWEAIDELTGSTVAVKLIPMGRRTADAIREAAILRGLVLPGVVRLLDEGQDGQERYLVTEKVEGRSFPGQDLPMPWSGLAEPARQLLQALAGVHAAGIIHGDLKPANVLVDAGGWTRLLDFGMAGRVEGAVDPPVVRGTPEYLAPELLVGQRPTPRADLFAVGVLLYKALLAEGPWPATDLSTLVRARWAPAPSLSGRGVDVPPNVSDAITRLLSIRPEDRPGDAVEALAVLGLHEARDPLPLPWRPEGPPLDAATLAGAFSGPERILHLPSDASCCLLSATGGDRSRVRLELEAWRAAGLIRQDRGSLRIERRDLDRLRRQAGRPLSPAPSARAAATHRTPLAASPPFPWLPTLDADAQAWAEAALEEGRRLHVEGDLGGALSSLELGLQVLQGEPSARALLGLLAVEYTVSALTTEQPPVLAHAAWELERAPDFSERPSLTGLLRSSRAALEGRPDEALEELERLQDPRGWPLESWREAVRIQAARRLPLAQERAAVEEAERRARGRPGRDVEARLAGWQGHLRYREGRFDEAASLHQRAAEDREDRHASLAARLNQASALVEAGRLDQARTVARTCLIEAETARDPLLEARAWWLLRTVQVRQRAPVEPDEELVDAAFMLGHGAQGAAVALGEATLARAKGDTARAARLAHRARAGFHAAGLLGPAVLAAAVEAEAGAIDGLAWARAHVGEVDPDEGNDFLLQAYALLFQATGRREWARLGAVAEAHCAETDLDRIIDVLSRRECRVLLAGAGGPQGGAKPGARLERD